MASTPSPTLRLILPVRAADEMQDIGAVDELELGETTALDIRSATARLRRWHSSAGSGKARCCRSLSLSQGAAPSSSSKCGPRVSLPNFRIRRVTRSAAIPQAGRTSLCSANSTASVLPILHELDALVQAVGRKADP